MKNLVLIITAVLLSFTVLSQNSSFDDYVEAKNSAIGIVGYHKAYYNSEVDGKLTYHYWGDYTEKGMKIIIEEANRKNSNRYLQACGLDI